MKRTETGKYLVEIDAEIIEIVPTFIEHRWQDVASLQDALAHADPSLIRKVAHNLKGSGRSFGFDTVTALGVRLERAARAENWRAIGKFIDLLIAYLERVEPVRAH